MQSMSARRRELLAQVVQQRAADFRAGDEARCVASFAQERLWFLDQLPEVGSAYNVAVGLRLEGALHRGALRDAFAEIIRRHAVLRTRFADVEEGVLQVIESRSLFHLEEVDLSALDESVRDVELVRIVQQHSNSPFSLAEGPLLRVVLLRLSVQRYTLLVVLHHIVSDAWSFNLLTREIGALYGAFSRGEPSPLPDLPIQYADYAIWQKEWLQGDVLEQQLRYWRKQLAGAPAALELPTDRPRPVPVSFAGASQTFTLPAALCRSLTQLCRAERATIFMLLLAAFQVLLSRWCGQQDIVIGTPVSGRTLPETESLIGFFLNMLPIRCQVHEQLSFRNFLKQVRETTLDAFDHQDIPFEKLVAELRPERDLSRQPIFQAVLSTQNGAQGARQLGEATVAGASSAAVSAKYELWLNLEIMPEGIEGCLDYSTALFDAETIGRLVARFAVLLQGIAENPGRALWRLPLMSADEAQRVLVEWNQTAREYDRNRCIHELFTEHVRRTPLAVALVCADRQLTYAQLDEQAEHLGRYLRQCGVGPDTTVALCMGRSHWLVIGMLGVLKAGGAYLPLDPDHPAARLGYMIEDAAPAVLLTQHSLEASLPRSADVTVVAIDALWEEIVARGAVGSGVSSAPKPSHLAYVIYTSGSTGRPKGVMVSQGSVVNCLRSLQHSIGVSDRDRMLALTTVSFDIAALEIFLPLIVGATVVLASREATMDGQLLAETIEQHDVTVMQATPATWQLLLASGWVGRSGLVALSGGEALRTELARDLLRRVKKLWNVYGPTETTIWSSARAIVGADERSIAEPVGGPLANTQIHVLDDYQQPVPIGFAGEICIAGDGLARGYLHRPGLTGERFVPSPFARGQRLYRTGDRARLRGDGTLEFLGRMDHQLKIRGFRVEAGDIETALLSRREVAQAVVVVREFEPGDARLIAYLVASASAALPGSEELRAHLRTSLPEYMIPAHFVELAALPMTPNGKLDRSALPRPEGRAQIRGEYVAPRTPTETMLAEIWAETLGLERVGIHDNFFELGGHSLLTPRIVSQIYERARVRVPVWAIFQSLSIAALAQNIEQLSAALADQMAAELAGEYTEGFV